MPATFGNGVPNRGTSERELDQWNQQMRQSPIYQSFMLRHGLPTNGRVKLTESQQEALERELAANGITIPNGMHIDAGGNLNQSNRLGRNIAIAAAIGGAALTGGAALGALGGAGAAGAGGAAGAAGAGAAGTGAGIGAGLGGALATTGWAAPMAGLAAPVAASGLGAGAAGVGAGAAGGLLASTVPSYAAPGAAGSVGLAPSVAASGSGTGGSLLSSVLRNPKTYETAGRLLSGAAGGAADERAGRNDAQSRQYQTQQQALVSLLGLDERGTMDRAQMGLTAPGQRTRQAILGSLLQTLQPVRIQAPAGIRMGNITGGLSPANLNPQARQAGLELQQQALQALRNRSDVPPPTNYAQTGMLPPPAYQSAGRGESLMSLLGLGLNAYGAVRGGR